MATKNQPYYDSESYTSDYRPDKSIYQDDTRIFHRGGFRYDTVEKVDSLEQEGGALEAKVLLSSAESAHLRLSAVADGTLRLKLWEGEAVFRDHTEMLAEPVFDLEEGRLTSGENGWEWKVFGYTVKIGNDPFDFTVLDADGGLVMELETEKLAGKYVSPALGFRRGPEGAQPYMSWRIHNRENFFGLGEKWNKVEKSSTHATIWASDTCGSNTNDMCYKSVPLLYSTRGWGVMLHSTFRSFWELGSFSYTAGSVLTEAPQLDAFLFLAPELKGLISKFTALSGRPQMPPRWALGMWMSRCQYESREEVEEVVERLREEKIPCDVVHLDPKWMETHYYFKIGVDACDFHWNEEGFPNHRDMLQDFSEKGFATSFWINPYLPEGQDIYEEAKEKGFMLLTPEGEVARLEHGNPVGMIDFTNPKAREWWKGYLKRRILDEGGWVLKPDYGDRVPEDCLAHNGMTGKELHNLYLHLFAKTGFEAAEEARGEGVVWRRSGYLGTQRYPGCWAGDTQVSFEGMQGAMRGGLSCGFNGEAFWSHDIAGFTAGVPTPESYCRWAEWGLLSPFCRFHGSSPREPWHYGEQAMAVVKKYARLRYEMMPWFLAQAQAACDTGLPIMRHMRLEFPEEPKVEVLDDQFMLGSDLLVAPVMESGAAERTVYFPEGTWHRVAGREEVIDGPCWRTVVAPIGELALFARGGAVIPHYAEPIQHLKDTPPNEWRIDVYAGTGERNLTVIEPDYEVDISCHVFGTTGELKIAATPIRGTIRLVGCPAVEVTGAKSWNIEQEDTLLEFDASEGMDIRWTHE
ncbi:MAG: glycoside hydrolase family 31 protein [Candidatus Sumerlaeota bacterium]